MSLLRLHPCVIVHTVPVSDTNSQEWRVHVLSSDSGCSHPRAKHTTIVMHLDEGVGRWWTGHDMHISGDYFGLSLYRNLSEGENRSELWVWNWKTSELQLVRLTTHYIIFKPHRSGSTFTIWRTRTSYSSMTITSWSRCSLLGTKRETRRKLAPCSSCCHTAERSADRKSTRLNSSHSGESRMPSSA